MSLSSSTLMGMIGAIVMFMGTRQILAGKLTLGGFFTYTMFLGYLAAPLFQVVGIGTQITEAIAGLERTREVLDETPENEDPDRTVTLAEIRGDVDFRGCNFAYEQKKTVLHDVSFHAQPGTVTALVGSSGSGKSTIIGLIAAFHKPNAGQGAGGWRSISRRFGWSPTARSSEWCCRIRSSSTGAFARTWCSPSPMRRKRNSARLRHRARGRVRREIRASVMTPSSASAG